MSVEENKAIIYRYMEEIWNKGNLDALDEFYAIDIERMRQNFAMIHSALANLHVTIDDLVAEEDRIVVRYTASGVHKGEFMGIPPTDKEFSIMEIRIYRIADGKIVQNWGLLDETSLKQQLGVTPPPG